MTSVNKVETAAAIYANLFDQSQGNELWRQFLSAPEIAGSRNAQSTKIRRLGALVASLYGGAGSINPAADYQRPNDITIEILFDRVAQVLVGVDENEMDVTAQGFEGTKSAFAMEAASAVRDFVVTDMLSLIQSGAGLTDTVSALLSPQVFIDAGKALDAQKVPQRGRIAIVPADKMWDNFDGTKKIAIGDHPLTKEIVEGRIGNFFGFETFTTTLLPVDTGPTPDEVAALFLHSSGAIAKVASELPRVKELPDDTSIGDLLQVFMRFGRVVADPNRVYTRPIQLSTG